MATIDYKLCVFRLGSTWRALGLLKVTYTYNTEVDMLHLANNKCLDNVRL